MITHYKLLLINNYGLIKISRKFFNIYTLSKIFDFQRILNYFLLV